MGSEHCTNMLVSHAHISVHGCKWQMYHSLSLWVLRDESAEPILQYTAFECGMCVVFVVDFTFFMQRIYQFACMGSYAEMLAKLHCTLNRMISLC